MKMLLAIVIVLSSLHTTLAQAQLTYVDDLDIKLISAFDHTDSILVQVEPNLDLGSLNVGCTNNYWLVLDKQMNNYDEIYTMLLSAKISGAKVQIGIDHASGNFCRLRRLTVQ